MSADSPWNLLMDPPPFGKKKHGPLWTPLSKVVTWPLPTLHSVYPVCIITLHNAYTKRKRCVSLKPQCCYAQVLHMLF